MAIQDYSWTLLGPHSGGVDFNMPPSVPHVIQGASVETEKKICRPFALRLWSGLEFLDTNTPLPSTHLNHRREIDALVAKPYARTDSIGTGRRNVRGEQATYER